MASSRTTGGAAAVSTARRDPARFWLACGALVVLALVWAAALAVRGVHSVPGILLDAAWASTIATVRTPPMIAVAQGFAWLGVAPGSLVVTAAVAVLLWWRRGIRGALAFVVIALLSEGNTRVMKAVDLRPRPHGDLWQGIGSFPSGHAAFAAVLAATFGMLFRRAWVWIIGFAGVAAMAVSRTVLDAHWLTDTFAGAASGAALAVLGWSLVPPGWITRRAGPRGSSEHPRRSASAQGGP